MDPSKLTTEESLFLLNETFLDVTRKGGLIDFITYVRGEDGKGTGKYCVKQTHLDGLFSATVWQDIPCKSGHRRLKHRVTGFVVEYPDHEKTISPGDARHVMERLQNVVNLLGNEYFHYSLHNWKSPPDFDASLGRWRAKAKKN